MGVGTHSRAFTGWTACAILLMGLEFEGLLRGMATEKIMLLREQSWESVGWLLPLLGWLWL